MERSLFEHLVQQTFDRLPPQFREVIENVGVVVEDYPSEDIARNLRLRSKHDLLGLYQGVPLPKRGTWYGMTPVVPDRISLYQKNIEAQCETEEQVIDKVYEVLIHEIGHYFGMSEEEIRSAGY
ncbi:MAG TPA: metallopeptidase family protein [Bacteroidota bacterium]|nr:metallopeptidase family protein [Bacteroidota bacterium]